eukprot:COSAG05_NODE_2743_length_2701_cov_11.046503_2_plen_129_part_00
MQRRKQIYSRMRLHQLRDLCMDEHVDFEGTKDELVRRLSDKDRGRLLAADSVAAKPAFGSSDHKTATMPGHVNSSTITRSKSPMVSRNRAESPLPRVAALENPHSRRPSTGGDEAKMQRAATVSGLTD